MIIYSVPMPRAVLELLAIRKVTTPRLPSPERLDRIFIDGGVFHILYLKYTILIWKKKDFIRKKLQIPLETVNTPSEPYSFL